MKYAAIFMVFILLASIIGVGYVYLTAAVVVEAASVHTMEAVNQPDSFADIQRQIAAGAVIGTPYTSKVPEDITNYQLVVYQLQLHNSCFLPAEMVEIQVTPRDGDVLQLGAEYGSVTLEPRSTQIVEARILTDINLYTTRELNITYYIWGRPFTLRTTIGN